MQSGQTPIIVWWDYLLASEIGPSVKSLKIVIPSDASYAAYYDQAISKTAPHPAAARLWEEYLYSTTGQNLWLQGEARPIELPNAGHGGTVDEPAYKALPPAPSGSVTFPTQAAAVRGREHRRPAVVQRDRLAVDQTVTASGAPGSLADPGASGSGPAAAAGAAQPARRPARLRRSRASCPSRVYICSACWLPMVAVAIGAFQDNNGSFTLSNISAATHGIYLHGFWQSIELSVLTSVVPGIFGLLIAYAIFTAKRGDILRQVAITASASSPTSAACRWPSCSSPHSARPAWSPLAEHHRASTPTSTGSTCTTSPAWCSSTCTSRSR